MVESLNYADERGQLSNSQKQAVITSLEKKRLGQKKHPILGQYV